MKSITITNGERDYKITQSKALDAAVIHHIEAKKLASGLVLDAMTYVTFSDPEIAWSLAHNVFASNNDRERDKTKWGWTVKEIEK